MNNAAVVTESLISGVFGAIVAIYVILGVAIGLGVFSLIRLATYAKKAKNQKPAEPAERKEDDGEKEELKKALEEERAAREKAEKALEEKQDAAKDLAEEKADCEACRQQQAHALAAAEQRVKELADQLAEKEAACDDCREKQEQEIAALKKRIEELENAPAPEPEVKTVTVEIEKERTLKESLTAAKELGTVGTISKQSIIDYLKNKYGDSLELVGRGNKTENGKLLLSDNHFAFSPDGKRVCFTYVYETDEGQVVSLVKLDAPYARELARDHKEVSHSRFPKNKENDWYSVVADDTFTDAAYYAVFDHAIERITGEEKEEEPMREMTLKEGLAAAKETGAVGTVSKKSIIEHLNEKYGDKVETNGRENRTSNGKLLLSDNHFAIPSNGKKVCFTYVYEDDDGKITLLIRTTAEHAKELRKTHKNAVYHSAFPKNKEADWYGVVVDDTFTENGVYELLDRAADRFLGGEAPVEEEEAPIETPVEEAPEEPIELEESGLKEGLAAAKENGAVGTVTKASIISHLSEAYGDKLALFGRKKRTDNGKLYVPDNHFAIKGNGQICFTYVYEDDDGYVLILARESARFVKKMHDAHGSTVTKSAFPKNKANDWYSFVVDEKYTENEVWTIFDEAIQYVLSLD